MKVTNRIIILLLFLALSSCTYEIKLKNNENPFTLEANLTNIPDSTVFYLQHTETIVDSAYVINGRISLKAQLNQHYHPENLVFFSTTPEFIYLGLLVKNGEHIRFNADKKDFPWNIDVSGSIHQDQTEKFNQLTYQKQKIIKELSRVYSSDKELLNKKLMQVSDSIDNVTIALLKKEFNSYAALSKFKYYKTKFSNNELHTLYNKLDKDLRETVIGKAIKLQSEFPTPEIGSTYYDYSAINNNGNSIALSNIKDKYILLNFTSSSCPYCLKAAPDLKEIYNIHSDSLEIVSISNDIEKQEWIKHIKRDSILWTYLWDGKGDSNDANIKYRNQGTPGYVLISPDKIILEKWTGHRDGLLQEKLEKYLN